MGNKRFQAPVLLLVFLCASSSCSVKEDRTACPCALYIDLCELPPAGVTLALTGEDYAGQLEAARDTTLVVKVPKTGVRVLAVSGATPGPDGRVVIPPGFDAPPLYLFSAGVPTPGDTAHVSVRLNKHYCQLSLTLESPPGWGEPYWTQVRGRVNGICQDGTPSEGEFSCRLDPGGVIRLPRQHPASELWLDIVMPDRLVRSFALGTYMLEAGYDWTAPDLEDLPLEIRLSVTRISLSVGTWRTLVPFPVEI